MSQYPIAGPWITALEIEAVSKAAAHDWYQHANDSVKAFESAFAKHCQRQYAVSLPSCTSGLHLALAARGVGPGDEVIVPNSTWIASTAPIHYVGAKPCFVDVDPLTWCLSPEQVAKAITPRTKAIIGVDLYGSMAEWNELQKIAEQRNLFLIEDAAEAVGSRYHHRPAGSFGDCSVFSFHGSKTLTTGEGGMLLTDQESLYQRILMLRDHGRKPGDTEFFNQEIAYKYKMSSLQAALGLAQLSRLEELVNQKRNIFQWYQTELKSVPDLQLNAEPKHVYQSYWMSTVIIGLSHRKNSLQIRNQLKQHGVDTRPFFHPVSSLPAYETSLQNQSAPDTPHAFHLAQQGLNLPSALSLERKDIKIICDHLKSILR